MTTQKIGRYEIARELGRGGMAIVYLARDPLMRREVALKVLPREFLHDPTFRARFEREAQAVAALEHPAIVPVYDFGEADGQPFIVMRCMTGGTLHRRIAQGPLPLPEIARLIQRIARALDRAHSRGIIHRDLKPGNILFDEDDEPYLSDFGIAKMTEASTAFTGTGLIGTPAYMSPEQARAAKDLDRRTDVYSLGVILFEMLTGQQPYHADTPMGLAIAHINDPVPRILEVKPDLPPPCEAVIQRALAKDRMARYATAGELADDVSQLAAGLALNRAEAVSTPTVAGPLPVPLPPVPLVAETPAGETASPGPPPTAVRPRRAPSWMALGAVGLVALLLVLALGGVIVLPALLIPVASPSPAPTAEIALVPSDTPSLTATRTPRPSPTFTLTPAFTSVPGPGSTLVSEVDNAVMVFVPAGEFLMGSSDSDSLASGDEKPQHPVYLDAFWIDRTEVTNAMYERCVDAGACGPPNITRSYSRSSYYGDSQFDDYPVIYVDWNDAKTYCEWAGKRLPTEAEWEKAARGMEGRIYPWGDSSPASNLLNFNVNVGDTTEVGSYPDGASPYGALDMAGNVSEWVNDWYDDTYFSSSRPENPAGPPSGRYRVLRGGSWYGHSGNVKTAYRYWYEPAVSSARLGLRCSRSP